MEKSSLNILSDILFCVTRNQGYYRLLLLLLYSLNY